MSRVLRLYFRDHFVMNTVLHAHDILVKIVVEFWSKSFQTCNESKNSQKLRVIVNAAHKTGHHHH